MEFCESNLFLIYPEIDYPGFKLAISLKISESDISFENFYFNAKTINPKYTVFMTALKIILFLVSFVMMIIYVRFYNNLNPFIQTFEHKAILTLSIHLIFFNDPFCILALIWPNLIFSIISCFFYALFLTDLIVFWSVMVRRIHKEATTPETKLLKNKFTIIIGNIYYFIILLINIRNFIIYFHFLKSYYRFSTY